MFLYKYFKKIALFLYVFIACINVWGQELILIKEQKIAPIQLISIDKKNQIFIANSAGDIEAYDSDLSKLNIRFSPQRMAHISFLEANATTRILVFYQEFQNFLILDRFLNPTGEYNFENAEISFVKLATIANDNNIWLIDEGDFSLKKYEVNLGQVLVNTSLDLLLDLENFEVSFLKEYQNQLFINDKNSGILVFDNLGNYRLTVDVKGLEFFSFHQNYLLYIQNQKLHFYDIYQQKVVKDKEIPLKDNIKYAFVFDKKLMTFSDKKIKLYSIQE